MSNIYTVQEKCTGLTAARTLLFIDAPSDGIVRILSASITNPLNETNEQLEACLQRITTLGTPTATTLTPAKHEEDSPAFSGVVKGNVSASEPTYTANTEMGYEGFGSLTGWFFRPTPLEIVCCAPSSDIGLRLLTTSFTSVDLIASMTFEKIGG